MEVVGYLLFGVIVVAVFGSLFRMLLKVVIVGAFLLGIYLIFFTDQLLFGILSLGFWLIIARASEMSEDKEKGVVPVESKRSDDSFSSSRKSVRQEKKKVTSGTGNNLNFLLMCIIPLFWPILIFRIFFRDKPACKLNEYDYEQHLKSNRK